MTYIDATLAPPRKTGQIRLYGKEGFEGMRKAGKLVAECLRPAWPGWSCRACRPTKLDKFVFEFALDHGALPATLMYRGYTQVGLHLDQPRRLPRYPEREAAARKVTSSISTSTFILDGWHGDSSRMYAVGEIHAAPSG